MDINLRVAQNIKSVREQRRLTLDAAASLTGVSRSMLVQIEKGDVNPSISVLWKIANGYKVSFSSLIERPREGESFVPCCPPMIEDEGRYLNHPTFRFDEERLFEIYRIIIAPGGGLEAEPHLAKSEEYLTVFQGSVQVKLEERSYLLELGDSLRFPADQRHSYHNPGEMEAQLSLLIYYGK